MHINLFKIKSLPQPPTHVVVFDNKHMKLFDVRLWPSHPAVFNIDFSDIFGHTLMFCFTTLLYQNTEDCILPGISEKG